MVSFNTAKLSENEKYARHGEKQVHKIKKGKKSVSTFVIEDDKETAVFFSNDNKGSDEYPHRGRGGYKGGYRGGHRGGQRGKHYQHRDRECCYVCRKMGHCARECLDRRGDVITDPKVRHDYQ